MKANATMKLNPFAHLFFIGTLVALVGCKQQLYTSLSERDANEMIAILAARNLQAEKVTNDKGDFRIELSKNDFSAAIEALRDHGLPRFHHERRTVFAKAADTEY